MDQVETKGVFRRAKLALVGEEKEEIKRSCRSFQIHVERETSGEKFVREIKRKNLAVVVYSWTINVKRLRPLTLKKKKKKRYFAISTSTNFSSSIV